NPEFSPDGRTLAFARFSHSGGHTIYSIPVSGGKEVRLTPRPTYIWGLAWTPDGRDILFAKAGWLADDSGIWKVSSSGGEPEQMRFGHDGLEPSSRGNRLVYVRRTASVNIRRRKLNSHSAGPPEMFISSTRMESGPQFSPDGSKITFESTRSGTYEVWMCR